MVGSFAIHLQPISVRPPEHRAWSLSVTRAAEGDADDRSTEECGVPLRSRVSGGRSDSQVELPRRRRVFVSYRREDTRYVAGRIADRVAEWWNVGKVFIDVESM